MMTLQRGLYGVGALALIIFVLVMHGSVGSLKTTVEGHTAILEKPVLDVAIFPGVPAAFAERWHKATHGSDFTAQDHLWLTLSLTNVGQSQARRITADLVLLPAISTIYSGGDALGDTPVVALESTGQTRATFTFLSLAPGNIHVAFIAVRPDGIAGPPYEVSAQRQWVAQHRAYWEHFTVVVEKQTTFMQYGFAPPLRTQQAANDPSGMHAPLGAPQRAAHSAP